MLVLGIIVFILVCVAFVASEEKDMERIIRENEGAYIIFK